MTVKAYFPIKLPPFCLPLTQEQANTFVGTYSPNSGRGKYICRDVFP
jgi:hypothetical protein